ncbi:hypothetical protein GQ42DRAFT_152604 [Ramicandelaber brevisporus]|nr:hypothetical protein GQ42DRAFT_152604 [Ramicandelaber brevisporus]
MHLLDLPADLLYLLTLFLSTRDAARALPTSRALFSHLFTRIWRNPQALFSKRHSALAAKLLPKYGHHIRLLSMAHDCPGIEVAQGEEGSVFGTMPNLVLVTVPFDSAYLFELHRLQSLSSVTVVVLHKYMRSGASKHSQLLSGKNPEKLEDVRDVVAYLSGLRGLRQIDWQLPKATVTCAGDIDGCWEEVEFGAAIVRHVKSLHYSARHRLLTTEQLGLADGRHNKQNRENGDASQSVRSEQSDKHKHDHGDGLEQAIEALPFVTGLNITAPDNACTFGLYSKLAASESMALRSRFPHIEWLKLPICCDAASTHAVSTGFFTPARFPQLTTLCLRPIYHRNEHRRSAHKRRRLQSLRSSIDPFQQQLWPTIVNLQILRQIHLDTFLDIVAQTPNVEILQASIVEHEVDYDVDPQIIRMHDLALHLPHLRQLELMCDGSTVSTRTPHAVNDGRRQSEALLERQRNPFVRLRSVLIRGCRFDSEMELAFFLRLPRLRRLWIRDFFITSLYEQAYGGITFDPAEPAVFDDLEHELSVVGGNGGITVQSLELWCNNATTNLDDLIRAIVKHCPVLRQLYLRDSVPDSWDYLAADKRAIQVAFDWHRPRSATFIAFPNTSHR